MAQELSLPCLGLVTDPSPHLAGVGALVRAENVVIRRAGLIEPRPGFGDLASLPATSSDTVRSLHAYDGMIYAHVKAGGGSWTLYRWNGSSWTSVAGSGQPPDPDRIEMRTVEARKNLYFTQQHTVRKLVGGSDTSVSSIDSIAGCPWGRNGKATAFPTTGTVWIANNSYAAYRVLIRREDGNGVVVRGAPSGRLVVQNTSGSTAAITLRFPIDNTVAGDTIEIYRSETSTGSVPSDEMQLALSYTITSADITNTYVEVTDRVSEGARGASLYTSPSQEGAEAANHAPPKCTELARFAGCVFYANTTRPASATLRQTQPHWTTASALNGTTSSGVNTITGISAAHIAQLKVGMWVNDTGTHPNVAGATFPAQTRITVVGASSVTLNNNATATGAVTFDAGPVIEIAGQPYYGAIGGESTASPPMFDVQASKRATAQSLAYVVNSFDPDVVVAAESESADDFTIVVSGTDFATSLTLKASGGDAFDTDITNEVTEAVDYAARRLEWSKQDEPEHAPLLNFALVGDGTKRILALAATRDALFIFKEDGLWRLSGTSPSDFRVDAFEPGVRLLIPETVAVLRDRVYAWTSRGVVAVSDAGVVDISAPIATSLGDIEQLLSSYPSGAKGAFALALPTSDEYVLFVPDATNDTASVRGYVFCASTTAWTTWEVAVQAAVHAPSDDLLYLAGYYATNSVAKERRTSTDWDHYDFLNTSRTISSIVGNVVTFDSLHILAVGDGLAMTAGGAVAIVTEVISTTSVRVDDPSVLSAAAVRQMNGFDCVVEWASQSGKNPLAQKFYREGALNFEDMSNVYAMTLGMASDLSPSFTEWSRTGTKVTSAQPRPVRFMTPRACARASRVKPRVTIHQATAHFALAGLSLIYEPVSERLRA